MLRDTPLHRFPFLDRSDYEMLIQILVALSDLLCQLLQLLWRDFFYTVAFGTPNFDKMNGNRICKQVI